MNGSLHIFDRKLVRRHRNRAAASFAEHDFLFREIGERLADRLDDITRRFPLAVEIGARGGLFRTIVGTRGRIELEPGDYVRIRVADTGVGIPTENLGRILEPFFTTKAVGHGTGLGLSMVFGFARQSGGSMHVQSEPGRGTEVDLYLPVSAPAESGELADTSPAPVRAGRIPLAGRRVLVVEDERLLAAMLARILEDAGFMVTLCHDGESALRVLAGETGGEPRDHSVVLTDILLGGGMDGWTLQRHVETRWPGLPVVTMSGFTASGPERGPGRAPTLQKPFRPRDVLAVLDDALA
jgi:CheY-like chemotaxis protein